MTEIDCSGLTNRDLQVLQLVAEGRNTPAIALELGYAEITIKKTVHSILRRLGARNRPHAVAMALRHGILQQPDSDLSPGGPAPAR